MMRLIDIEELKKNIAEKIGDFPHRKLLFNLIDSQPTAYDIDETIKQYKKGFDDGFEQALKIALQDTEVGK